MLAARDPVVLSDHSAAGLFRLESLSPAGAVELTVPAHRRVQRPGLIVHRRDLEEHEITRHHGLPTTTPKRTLEDLAKRVAARQRQTEETAVAADLAATLARADADTGRLPDARAA